MTDISPQEAGRQYEKELAEKIGGAVVKGSGNGFTKMDVNGTSVLWSCKHTTFRSFRVDEELFKETERAIHGPGGIGGDIVGAVVVKTANQEVACIPLDDLLMLLHENRAVATNGAYPSVDMSKRTPALLRTEKT